MIRPDHDFEWDDAKNRANLEKHGIDFDEARQIFDEAVTEKPDLRRDYGESRTVAYGFPGDRLIPVVYTWRNNVRRIISAKRARRDERREHHQAEGRRQA